MRYCVITGNHPRHLHYLNSIVNSCNVVGAILENREDFIPQPPPNLESRDQDNFIRHFKNRKKYEDKYFGLEENLLNFPINYINEKPFSIKKNIQFIENIKPNIFFVFGVLDLTYKIIKLLAHSKYVFINLNTGLIQRYNGDATLFWPFYFLEPNWAGSTFHLITGEPDAGNIIHQSIPKLEYGDTIHEVACKVVKQSAIDVKKIINTLESGKELAFHKQQSSGKFFLSRDFIPQHLRVVYNLYNDDIVDQFLDSKIRPDGPNVITLD